MIFKNTFSIVAYIEEAKRLNNYIMLFSEEPMTRYYSSKLASLISKLQAYSILLKAECINLVMDNKDLENNDRLRSQQQSSNVRAIP